MKNTIKELEEKNKELEKEIINLKLRIGELYAALTTEKCMSKK